MHTHQDSFCDFVLDQLNELENVRARKMFSGYGFYAGATFFAIISNNHLYFKTDEITKKKFEQYNMQPFAPSKRQVLKNYYEVPEEIIENRETLTLWAREAITTSIFSH